MEKILAIKLIKNEVEIILKKCKIKHVTDFDNGDIIIACRSKHDAQDAYNNLKSRYLNKKYWEYTSNIIVKNDYIVRINLY
jgi:L-rhamnose mutarotase